MPGLDLQALIADQANVGFLSLSTALQGRENGRNIKLGAAVQKTNNWTPIVSVKFLAKKGIDPAAFVKLPPRERFAVLKGTTWAVNAADRTYRHLRVAHGWSPEEAAGSIELLVRGLEP